MDAPFYKFGLFGENASLLVAFVIGLGFGFFLENAGFGSGNKLAKQFYFRDMAVLKVMFTAIVTAMLGVFWLSRIGFLDLSQVYLVPTHLWAQVVGGLVLGLGFVIGGYCPGTSVVAAATGRVDAMVYMGGMFAGMVMVGFAMPALDGFMNAASMGQVTLATAWNIPYGVLVALVVLMAAGAFLASEWAEVKTGSQPRATQPLLGAKGLSRSRKLVLAFLALGVFASMAGNPYRGPDVRVREQELTQVVSRDADHVTVEDLAARLIAGTDVPRLVDLREPEAYARYHLPGAENLPMAKLASADWRADETVLLYSGADPHAAQAWVLLKSRRLPRVYTVEGGIDAWNERVLFPRLADGDVNEANRQASVAKHFGGTPRGGSASPELKEAPLPVPPPPADVPAGDQPAPKKKAKKEGC
jgi:rhodanese-related sulfurtransferase